MTNSSEMRDRERVAAASTFVQTIGGAAVRGRGRLEVVNPATARAFAASPDASQEDLDAAVSAARAALPAWSASGFERRRGCLLAFAEAILRRRDEIAALITLEQGKPFERALDEVRRTAVTIEMVTRLRIDPEVLRQDERGRVELHYRPLGVAAGITPWNVPVGLAVGKIVHALYTGNTMLLKPSPLTPLATLKLGECGAAALPPGVLNVLAGGNDLGRWMTEHPGIDKLSFTGSGPTGKRVLASAAGTLKRVTLELGGNDAAIVLDDADVAAIAPRLYNASFANSGQICMAIKRLYVHSARYDEVCEAIAARVGDGFEPGVELGPVQNAAQHAQIVGLLEDCRSRDARFLAGGHVIDRPGYFIAPTVVAGLREGSRLVDEEPFGPILPILRFDDIEEAVHRANDTSFGLSASVWGSDIERAASIASRMQVGTAWVNQHLALDPFVPFGGAKQSGLGREFSTIGLKSYMESTALHVPIAPIA